MPATSAPARQTLAPLRFLQVRDLDKMELVAEMDGFPEESFTPMHCELNSFESVRRRPPAPLNPRPTRRPARRDCDCTSLIASQVRSFVNKLEEFKSGKPIDRLICNAAVYQPSLPYAKWSVDGHEQQMQINYLSHFLLTSLLLEDLAKCVHVRLPAFRVAPPLLGRPP